jgi:opacity protein-like surface antigen
MSRKLLLMGAVMAVLAVSAAQAQDMKNDNQSASASQSDGSAAPSADTSGYGGAVAKSASGSMMKAPGTQQPVCVGPASFCDIYKGGQ